MSYHKEKNENRPINLYLNAGANSIKYYYPGNVFSEYQTQIQTFKGNRIDNYGKIGTVPTSHKTLNATVSSLTVADGFISVNSTGSFDHMRIQSEQAWTASDGSPNSLNWFIYMNDDDKNQFKLLPIPSEILNEYPQFSGVPINYKKAVLIESDGYGSYQDVIRLALQPTEIGYRWTESFVTTIFF
jgi:hypothetical protein